MSTLISRQIWILVVASSATLSSGCAVNPLVTWTRPAAEASPVSLAYAQRYADAARSGYQRAKQDYVSASTGLNSTLLGLGVVGTALAVSKAHRDVLLGTALVGGTSYAYGKQSLNPQHMLVYEAGIDAIGCAKEAVGPLAMSKEDRTLLESAMGVVETSVIAASRAKAVASGALLEWNATGPSSTAEDAAAQAAISSAAAAIDAGNKSVTSGRLLITRASQSGDKLVNAVEKIDSAVNKAISATLPDPSSVFKVISSLAGFSAGIVPGSDAFINAAIATSTAALKPPVAPQAGMLDTSGRNNEAQGRSLFNALVKLNQATDELNLALARVNGRLPTEDALLGLQALKDCGVTDVAFALKASPAKVTFTAGADRKSGFTISGGTPPYAARPQFSPVQGVTVVPPVPYDSTVGVEITKDAPVQTVPVIVMDAAKPSKTLVVMVEITAAEGGKSGPDPAAAPQAGSLPTDATGLARAINRQVVFQRADTDLSIGTNAIVKSATDVPVTLRCKPKPPQCIKAADAAGTLVKAVGAPSKLASVLKVKGAAGCICPG